MESLCANFISSCVCLWPSARGFLTRAQLFSAYPSASFSLRITERIFMKFGIEIYNMSTHSSLSLIRAAVMDTQNEDLRVFISESQA
jgi:hypothetical protein